MSYGPREATDYARKINALSALFAAYAPPGISLDRLSRAFPKPPKPDPKARAKALLSAPARRLPKPVIKRRKRRWS